MVKRQHEREFLLEFIEMYRQFPTLWQVNSKDYRDRQKKSEAYKVLVEKFKELEENADREIVKKKINSLRTNYRKELRKMEEARRFGKDYQPTLWYFKELAFLKELETGNNKELEDHLSLKFQENDATKTNLEYSSNRKKIKFESDVEPSIGDYEMDIVRAWVQELKRMNYYQQILAKKAINDIIHKGLLAAFNEQAVFKQSSPTKIAPLQK